MNNMRTDTFFQQFRYWDLNLLVVFEALHCEQGNVSRAAKRIGLSQSAMSHALNRLREMLDDPLFVKQGHRMHPTSRALALAPVTDSLRVAGRISTRTHAGALLFITFDSRGVIVIEGEQATPLPADVASEVDPTGAGDTFCGATLAGLARGETPALSAQNATALAARVIEHVGPAFLLGVPMIGNG